MRRSGHPSRARAITCCFVASLQTLLISTKATCLTPKSTSPALFSLAGFQVILIGRFWVTPEALSGLISGASNISCSCQMSSMMRSTSIRLNIQHGRGIRQMERHLQRQRLRDSSAATDDGSAERKICEGLRGRTEPSATPRDWNRLPMPEISPPCTFLPEIPSTYLALSATRGRQTSNVRFDTPERLPAQRSSSQTNRPAKRAPPTPGCSTSCSTPATCRHPTTARSASPKRAGRRCRHLDVM
jgi:hypothetical protein